MAVTDLHAALTTLKGALPSLETLAMADSRRRELDATIAGLNAEVASLTTQRQTLKGTIEDEQKAAVSAREKIARDHAAALGMGEERIKDLQRSQQIAEQQLEATRSEAARIRNEQVAEYDRVEQIHERKVRDLVVQTRKAEADLKTAQDKIKALHGNLAGVVSPQA